MSKERASVKDVAELAGVSVGTVSNVLNRPETVSDRTRAKVEAAMSELRFLRNASARQLRAGVSTTVGAVLIDLGNPFYTEIARGIEDRLAIDGLTLMLCSSDEDARREAGFLRQFAEHGVRGMLVTPMAATTERLLELRELGIGSVLVDAASDLLPTVRVDHISGGRQAVAHLVERGHRRILFLGDDPNLQQSQHRLRGAIEAVDAAGLSPPRSSPPSRSRSWARPPPARRRSWPSWVARATPDRGLLPQRHGRPRRAARPAAARHLRAGRARDRRLRRPLLGR